MGIDSHKLNILVFEKSREDLWSSTVACMLNMYSVTGVFHACNQ